MPPPARVDSCCLGTVLATAAHLRAGSRRPVVGRPPEHLLAEQMSFQMKRRASASEMRSWDAASRALAADLLQAGLGDVEVLLEYQLPLTSKRVDVVLAGRHPRRDGPSYVVVELKQWTDAERFEDDAELVVQPTYGARPVLHPGRPGARLLRVPAGLRRRRCTGRRTSWPARPTCTTPRRPGSARCCNYPQDELGRLFTGQSRGEFLDFLRSRLAPSDGSHYADRLLRSADRAEQAAAGGGGRGDPAAGAVRAARRAARRLRPRAARGGEGAAGDHKSVVIVSGGPGSGKSVIALSLLGELTRRGRDGDPRDRVALVHPDPAQGRRQGLRARSRRCSSTSTVHGRRQERPRRPDPRRGAPDPGDLGQPLDQGRAPHRQARRSTSCIDAARVPVFLLDEYQVVRPGELGTVEDIEKHARERGTRRSHAVDLDAQFRCGGSRGVRRLGRATARPRAGRADPVDRRPPLRGPGRRLRRRDGGRTSRPSWLTATARAWPPATAGRGVTRGRTARWSPTSRSATGAGRGTSRATARSAAHPPAALWASDPAGFGQVGCVYTAQGFEYDWTASSSGRTWCGETTAGSPSARQQGPGLPQPHQGQRRGVRPRWSATSTRCC